MPIGLANKPVPVPGQTGRFTTFVADPSPAIAVRKVRDRWGLTSVFGINWPPVVSAADITISANTTWTDASGYKIVGTLTINSNITLTIGVTPFLILCENLVFGNTSSTIRSGLDGAASDHAQWENFARGGTGEDSPDNRAQGGSGGGILFVVVTGACSGAAGVIDASGGDGYGDGNNTAGNASGQGGQGAFSRSILGTVAEQWEDGPPLPIFNQLLGRGGGPSNMRGENGGSSDVNNSTGSGEVGGGSGIGGGGGTTTGGGISTESAGGVGVIAPSPWHILTLAQMGCLGGGGGGAYGRSPNNDNQFAGGGGGGAVVYWVGTETTVATLKADGGASTATGTASPGTGAGGAGVTHRIAL